MYFHKMPHLGNFAFLRDGVVEDKERDERRVVFDVPRAGPRRGRSAARRLRVRIRDLAADVYHIRFAYSRWGRNRSQAELDIPPRRGADRGATELRVNGELGLYLVDRKGRTLLKSARGMSFGLCGDASAFAFEHGPRRQYYGMGEKLFGLELSGRSTKFWNTDVLADFRGSMVTEACVDPLYVSIPWLIVKQGNVYLGLLLHNPHCTFMQTAAPVRVEGLMGVGGAADSVVVLGAEQGAPDLFILYGPSLPELTRKFQSLVGATPLPPAWALGYHQSRWGYESIRDLRRLDRRMAEHGIPCDGLWLDIDYMDGYRVFTIDKRHFPNPRDAMAALRRKGRRVVPILDPGIAPRRGDATCDSGRARDVFCRNPQGREYVGLAWPGDCLFPDFSLAEGRDWWAEQVARFAGLGIEGAWLDMNDPSTGRSANSDMLFRRGRESHDTFHNQYATGMARASRAGFLRAHPDRRPFLLSRSASTGAARYTAVWTGDNVSNYTYLRQAIPTSINLALSGMPFNGPDIGGFCGDASGALIRDWMKACFLFPFCRNHSARHSRPQEPWAFDERTLTTLRHYIQCRYRLRPYLYQLFREQETSGEAILRPLFYDFRDTAALPLGRIDDQFMIGPWIMQAPVVTEKTTRRDVVLPGRAPWWSASDAAWVDGPRAARVSAAGRKTPLYIREGAVLPVSHLPAGENTFAPLRVAFHIYLHPGGRASTQAAYYADDGVSQACRRGQYTDAVIRAAVRNGVLRLSVEHRHAGYGRIVPRFVVDPAFATATLTVDGQRVAARTRKHAWRLAGARQPGLLVEPAV